MTPPPAKPRSSSATLAVLLAIALPFVLLGLMMMLGTSCGDNRTVIPSDAPLTVELDTGVPVGALFGEACTQPVFPEIGVCHGGEGGCTDVPAGAGSVCRPWCHVDGEPECEARGGIDHITDRGACVCIPPP